MNWISYKNLYLPDNELQKKLGFATNSKILFKQKSVRLLFKVNLFNYSVCVNWWWPVLDLHILASGAKPLYSPSPGKIIVLMVFLII